jgi:hypothetical protein
VQPDKPTHSANVVYQLSSNHKLESSNSRKALKPSSIKATLYGQPTSKKQ